MKVFVFTFPVWPFLFFRNLSYILTVNTNLKGNILQSFVFFLQIRYFLTLHIFYPLSSQVLSPLTYILDRLLHILGLEVLVGRLLLNLGLIGV